MKRKISFPPLLSQIELVHAQGFVDLTSQRKICQACGDYFTEGPTSLDRERFERGVCGGCDDTTTPEQDAAELARGERLRTMDGEPRVPAKDVR